MGQSLPPESSRSDGRTGETVPGSDRPSGASKPSEPRTGLYASTPPVESDENLTLPRNYSYHNELTRESPDDTPRVSIPVRLPSIPGYEVLEILGRGGMGVVYKARQIGLDRPVALKMVLAGNHAGDSELARFRAEASAVARLHHPNIVQIHEVGEVDGYPYFSLEYVEGGSLAQLLEGVRIAPQEAARLICILAAAMQYAHENGILHRDLKPANILMSPNPIRPAEVPDPNASTPPLRLGPTWATGTSSLGRPKIADFGLAKRLDDDSGGTVSGTILGTPSYMAPEQAEGNARKLGPPADIHALGAILYEMLTGHPPFRSSSIVETLDHVRRLEPIAPSTLQPRIPLDLETICLKCLRKEARRRYANCQHLADDLQAFLEGRPISARPVGTFERGWRWCLRNPRAALLIGGIVLSLVVGLAVSTYFAFRAAAGERLAQDNEKIALQRKDESDRRRYAAEFRWAWQKWKDGQLLEVRRTLNGLLPEPGEADLRGFEWYYLNRLGQGELKSIPAHTGMVFRVVCSPNGLHVATAGYDGQVRVWDRAGGQLLWSSPPGRPVRALAFSPDGDLLASGGEDNLIRMWEVASGTDRTPFTGHEAAVRGLAFYPHLPLLASCGSDKSVRLWDLKTGRATELEPQPSPLLDLAFSPEGEWLYTAGEDHSVGIWAMPDGKLVRRFEEHAGAVNCVAVSRDGLVATADADRQIKLWTADGQRATVSLPGHDSAVYGLAFSPDGKRLASCGRDSTVRIWDLDTRRERMSLRSHVGTIAGLAFGPEGRQLFSAGADGTLKFWDATSSPEELRLRGHQSVASDVEFLIDGRVASASWDGTVRVWNPETGFEACCLRGHDGTVVRVACPCLVGCLATTGRDGTIRFWNPDTGVETARHSDPAWVGVCACSDLSPCGGRVATAEPGGRIVVRDAASGKPLHVLGGHTGQVRCLRFSRDGTKLVSVADDSTTRLWEVDTGELISVYPESEGARCAALSRDGRYLIEGSNLRLWDLESNTLRLTLQSKGHQLWSAAFSPDGKRVVSTTSDGLVRVWDTGTGLELLSLAGMSRSGRALAFSEDGLTLAGACEDGVIYLWKGATLDSEQLRRREAVSLLRFWGDRSEDRPKVVERIRADRSATEEIRNLAVELLGPKN